MSELSIIDHALERMAQRSFRAEDPDLILMIGTEVEGGYMVLARDCQAAERALKQLLNEVRRLEGKRLVVRGGTVITAYRPQRRSVRRLVRGASDRDLAA